MIIKFYMKMMTLYFMKGISKMKKDLILFVVIPCYNEEEVLGITTETLEKKMDRLIGNKIISKNSKIS